MFSITIEDTFTYTRAILFGLDIVGASKSFPLVIGCSAIDQQGNIVNIPHREIVSPGLALWQIKTNELEGKFRVGGQPPFNDAYAGQIIFALWENATFTNRLADTGWHNWQTVNLTGSSTVGLDYMEDGIKMKYGNRMKAFRDGKI